MSRSPASWRPRAALLALVGVAISVGASCGGASHDVAVEQEAVGRAESAGQPVASVQPSVRTLVVQVAGMKKSKGGST